MDEGGEQNSDLSGAYDDALALMDGAAPELLEMLIRTEKSTSKSQFQNSNHNKEEHNGDVKKEGEGLGRHCNEKLDSNYFECPWPSIAICQRWLPNLHQAAGGHEHCRTEHKEKPAQN